MVRPFVIDIPQEQLDELKARLASARFPELVEDYGWAEGTDGTNLREISHFWASDYDWRVREAELNRFDHFIASIEGVDIHFIRSEPEGGGGIPLLLMMVGRQALCRCSRSCRSSPKDGRIEHPVSK